MVAIIGLFQPTDRRRQDVKGVQKTPCPAVIQVSTNTAQKVVPPIPEIGTCQFGTGPVAIMTTMKNVGTDHCDAGAYPGKMAGRAQCQDTIAGRATEALQIKAGWKTTEIAGNVAMPPETVMTAAGACRRTLPRKIFTKGKNILEYSRNEMYHALQRLRVETPSGNKGGEFSYNSPPTSFPQNKMVSK